MERKVLPLRNQAQLFDEALADRLDNLLPQLMKRQNISMWIVMNREYNEDPVYLSMVPALARYARRLSCLIFYRTEDDHVTRYCLGNDRDFKGMYTVIPWAPPTDRMALLREGRPRPPCWSWPPGSWRSAGPIRRGSGTT